MKKKKNEAMTIHRKSNQSFVFYLKILLVLLTAVYSLFMVTMSGAGLIYNSESYGAKLTETGILFVVSGVLMTVGTALCCFKKNIVSLIFSATGFIMCMTMLYRLTNHADRSGWSEPTSMQPVSNMYYIRILPVIAPFVLNIIVAAIQFFSYDAIQKRQLKLQKKREIENKPSPPII